MKLSFKNRYWLGLFFIALFTTAAYVNLLSVINAQLDDGKNINISGEQRMLSQKILFYASRYQQNRDIDIYAHALNAVKKMRANNDYLLSLDMQNPYLNNYFHNELQPDVLRFIEQASAYFRQNDAQSYRYILENSESILNKLDKAVTLFQNESEANQDLLINNASIILGLTLIVLLLNAKYIFLPIHRENTRQANSLKQINKILEEKVQLKTEEVSQLLEAVGKHVIITKTDTNGKLTYCSDAFCKMIEKKHKDLLGKEHPLFLNFKNNRKRLLSMLKELKHSRVHTKVIIHTDSKKQKQWIETKTVSILGMHGDIIGYLTVGEDVSARVKSDEHRNSLELKNQKLQTLAYTCALTHVFNRRIFEEILKKEIALLKRYPIKNATLVFLDIDHFKLVNDTYGHIKGDEILVEFCKRIGKELRSSDIFARWGGEEFVILLKDTNLELATSKAEELRLLIEQTPLMDIDITCSLGVTALTKDANINSVIHDADILMYQAKQQGRNQVVSL